MYYNQSFDEKPEDMLLHGKLKNDGGHTNTTRMHLPKDAEKTALRLVRIMLKRLRASGRPMPVKYTMPPFFEFEGGQV